MKPLDNAVYLCEHGNFSEAQSILEELILDDPKNPIILYNLGMCYTELGKPEAAINTLKQCTQYSPDFSNAFVALGVAFSKVGNYAEAKQSINKALEIDARNSYALRNMGAILAQEKNSISALQYLKKAFDINPDDAQTNYGLGLQYLDLGDINNADKHFKKVVELNNPLHIVELAKNQLREIAAKNLKSKGFRTDAMFYCLSALEKFSGLLPEDVRNIAFEIAMKGRQGLDINNPDKKYSLTSMPGSFSGLALVSYMYVGFKQIAPEQNVGLDLSEEYNMALKMFGKDETL